MQERAPTGRPPWLDGVADGTLSPARALAELAERGPAEPRREGEDSLERVMAELDQLVGLQPVKQAVQELRAYVEVQRRRQLVGLACEPMVLHMVFKGNPGTGKTTVARLVGRMLKHLGVLPRGHTVEVERADLVGEYVGHTAQRTREQIRRAMGGVLFVDEAYSLARGGEKDFGREAVDTLVKAMEDHRHELVCIMAGYRMEMEWFLQMNPGLRSRVPFVIDFPDYSAQELLEIADQMLQSRDYRLSPEARERLLAVLWHHRLSELTHFGNARLLRNLLERAIRQQAVRLQRVPHAGRDELMLLREQDIPWAPQGPVE